MNSSRMTAARAGKTSRMSSMGDLGRQVEQIRDDPKPANPPDELSDLEQRLDEYFTWAHGRSEQEIRSRFESDFAKGPLAEDMVAGLREGRGREFRTRLPLG
jgi:hypothetical protein